MKHTLCVIINPIQISIELVQMLINWMVLFSMTILYALLVLFVAVIVTTITSIYDLFYSYSPEIHLLPRNHVVACQSVIQS